MANMRVQSIIGEQGHLNKCTMLRIAWKQRHSWAGGSELQKKRNTWVLQLCDQHEPHTSCQQGPHFFFFFFEFVNSWEIYTK